MDSLIDLLSSIGVPIRNALAPLDRGGRGFLMVVDESGVLVGVLTDGDIRRAMLRGVTPADSVAQAMREDFVSLPVDASTSEINHALSERIAFVPLVDDCRKTRRLREPRATPALSGRRAPARRKRGGVPPRMRSHRLDLVAGPVRPRLRARRRRLPPTRRSR